MAGERITLSENFETLIAQAGLSKAELSQRAGVNRQVIFRALNPAPYESGGTLRGKTAWKLAQAYAAHTDLELEMAFAQLFVVTGQSAHTIGVSQPSYEAPEGMSQSTDRETLDVRAKTSRQSTNIRLDDESLGMLDALMQDEDRSSQREMIRVLIKRAYRALLARRSTTEIALSNAPSSDGWQKERQ
jgi:hypothetical protein